MSVIVTITNRRRRRNRLLWWVEAQLAYPYRWGRRRWGQRRWGQSRLDQRRRSPALGEEAQARAHIRAGEMIAACAARRWRDLAPSTSTCVTAT